MVSDLENKVLRYVEEHPGCLRRDIVDGLNFEYNPDYITKALCAFRREGFVRNEIPGGRTADTRWYFIAHPPARPVKPSRQIAYLIRETGCTPNAAKTALAICASSAGYIQRNNTRGSRSS